MKTKLGYFFVALPFIVILGVASAVDWKAMLICVALTVAVCGSIALGMWLVEEGRR